MAGHRLRLSVPRHAFLSRSARCMRPYSHGGTTLGVVAVQRMKPRPAPLITVAIVLPMILALALRLYRFDELSIWLDEGSTIHFARRPWLTCSGSTVAMTPIHRSTTTRHPRWAPGGTPRIGRIDSSTTRSLTRSLVWADYQISPGGSGRHESVDRHPQGASRLPATHFSRFWAHQPHSRACRARTDRARAAVPSQVRRAHGRDPLRWTLGPTNV